VHHRLLRPRGLRALTEARRGRPSTEAVAPVDAATMAGGDLRRDEGLLRSHRLGLRGGQVPQVTPRAFSRWRTSRPAASGVQVLASLKLASAACGATSDSAGARSSRGLVYRGSQPSGVGRDDLGRVLLELIFVGRHFHVMDLGVIPGDGGLIERDAGRGGRERGVHARALEGWSGQGDPPPRCPRTLVAERTAPAAPVSRSIASSAARLPRS
jgi:hypothetical protein